jgi:hypothetical protein
MKLLSVFVTACLLLVRVSFAQSVSPTATATTPPAPVQAPKSSEHGKAASAKSRASDNTAQLEAALVQLTQSNRDLLDLLKKQQAVLEDIQFDRRLQSRQIQSLEDRLEETLLQKSQLENKVANLEADASAAPANPSPSEPGRHHAAAAGHLSAAARNGKHARNEIVAPAIHAQGREWPELRSLSDQWPDLARVLA